MAVFVPLTDAQAAALKLVTPGKVVLRPLEEAFGLFLAEPVRAARPLPGCDNSAMDGYALRSEETRGATRDRPSVLKVVGAIYAGQAPNASVGPGEAVRIFTGAQVPEGADAIIRQEATRQDGESVSVFAEAERGEHIRLRGEELAEGTHVFAQGQRVDPYAAALLASLGFAQVPVYAPVAVGLLTVGDELLAPGEPCAPHQLYESNSKLLAGLVRECNGEVVSTRRAKDELETLKRALQESAQKAEVLITSGGASVGDKDLVKQALRELGAEFAVDGVAIKPGKPVAIAKLGEKLVAVLPGNPGAASVAFDQLVRPMLFARQGVRELRRIINVRLDSKRTKQPGMSVILSARLDFRDGAPWAAIRRQGAGQLFGNVDLDGWVVLPRGRADYFEGELVDLHLVHGARFEPLSEVSAPRRSIPRAVSVVGWSESGKTTLLEALVRELTARGMKVAVMKHSSHNHALDKPGSDTARFAQAGANPVAFAIAEGTQLVSRESPAAVVARLQESGADIVLVEGWKSGPLPKLELRHSGADPINAPGTEAVITRDTPIAEVVDRVLELARGGRGR